MNVDFKKDFSLPGSINICAHLSVACHRCRCVQTVQDPLQCLMYMYFYIFLQERDFFQQNIQGIVSNKIIFLILRFDYGKINVQLIFYHKYCLFPFFFVKTSVKQCFVELLYRMTTI